MKKELKKFFSHIKNNDWDKAGKEMKKIKRETKDFFNCVFGVLDTLITKFDEKILEESIKDSLVAALINPKYKGKEYDEEKKEIIRVLFGDLKIRTYRMGLSKNTTCDILENFILKNPYVIKDLRHHKYGKIDILYDGFKKYKVIVRNKKEDEIYTCKKVGETYEFQYKDFRKKKEIKFKELKLKKLIRKLFKKVVFKKDTYRNFLNRDNEESMLIEASRAETALYKKDLLKNRI